jgi:hypothetical protein
VRSNIRPKLYLTTLIDRGKVPDIQYLAVDSANTLCRYEGGWADIKGDIRMDATTTMMAYSNEQDDHSSRSAPTGGRESGSAGRSDGSL